MNPAEIREQVEALTEYSGAEMQVWSHDTKWIRKSKILAILGEEKFKREFPEEEVKGLIARSRLRDRDEKFNVSSLEEVTGWFKRLWEGEKPKGGCPRCGGSGEVPCDVAYPEKDWCAGHSVPCPDCDGTGEHRE